MTTFDSDRERSLAEQEARAVAYRGVGRLRMAPVMSVELPNRLVGVGVSFDDRLIVVGTDADPSQTFAAREQADPQAAGFPCSTAPAPYSIDVDIIEDSGRGGNEARDRRRLDGVSVAGPLVQVCPTGEVLVVGARSRWIGGSGEPNAFVYGVDGAIRTSFCIGDGVEQVQVTPSGRVWVGYFDEGVLGNFGWGGGGEHEPLGSSGLVCWSLEGERSYQFWPPSGFDRIIDCYAMSVANETAWACYDSDFPVVSVDSNFGATGWECGVTGATSIAAAGGRVALVGGYRGLFDRIVIMDVVDDELADRRVFQLALPDGADLPVDTKIVARGRFVHAVVDGRWLRLDLGAVDSAG